MLNLFTEHRELCSEERRTFPSLGNRKESHFLFAVREEGKEGEEDACKLVFLGLQVV